MEAEAKDKNRMLQSGFPEVLVHGPYGKLSLDLKQYSALVLVAGGIGFTPLANTLGHILAGRASGGGLGLPGGRYPRLEAVTVVWVCKSARAIKAFHEVGRGGGDSTLHPRPPHSPTFSLRPPQRPPTTPPSSAA